MGIRLAALLVLVVGSSSAEAQRPVTGCSQQCLPTDSDVNLDVPVRGGTVETIFYAHGVKLVGFAPLNLQVPDPTEEDVPQAWSLPHARPGLGGPVSVSFEHPPIELFLIAGRVTHTEEGWRSD